MSSLSSETKEFALPDDSSIRVAVLCCLSPPKEAELSLQVHRCVEQLPEKTRYIIIEVLFCPDALNGT